MLSLPVLQETDVPTTNHRLLWRVGSGPTVELQGTDVPTTNHRGGVVEDDPAPGVLQETDVPTTNHRGFRVTGVFRSRRILVGKTPNLTAATALA